MVVSTKTQKVEVLRASQKKAKKNPKLRIQRTSLSRWAEAQAQRGSSEAQQPAEFPAAAQSKLHGQGHSLPLSLGFRV